MIKKYLPAIFFSIAFVLLLLFLNTRNSLNFIENNDEIISTPTTTPSSTALKTYKNTQYKFTLDYPQDWQVEEISDNETFSLPLRNIQFTSPSKNITLIFGIKKTGEKIITSGRTGLGGGEPIAAKSIMLNGKSITRYIWEEKPLCSESYYNIKSKLPGEFAIGNYSYIIDIISKNNYNICSAPELDTIDQILSTFKFIDSTNNNFVVGIQTTTCCSCPTVIDVSQIGINGWVEYQQGKNYSKQLPQICSSPNIGMCAPCPPVEADTL